MLVLLNSNSFCMLSNFSCSLLSSDFFFQNWRFQNGLPNTFRVSSCIFLNCVAITMKKLRTPKVDYWIKQWFFSIAPLSKWEPLLKERICSLFFPLWAVPYSMVYNFYHIKWPPLNITIFITHVRNLRNGCYANVSVGPDLSPICLQWFSEDDSKFFFFCFFFQLAELTL